MTEAPKTAAAKLSEISNGEMKEIAVGKTNVLLARVDDRCYAVAANCTHYGAPLAEGALNGDRIVCPWHHACFNARTGDMEEPPALDSLQNYKVEIVGDDIFVDVPDEAPDRRLPTMVEPAIEKDRRVFIILGGGAAGYAAAQTLREDGFQGRIVMITREDRSPYDRPNLSKDYLQGAAQPEWMPLRDDEFFTENGIEVLRNKEVGKVNAVERSIAFNDGENMEYDSLLLATGGIPRKLDLPNSGLKNIFLLRSFDNADSIIASAEGAKKAVVIGASFIGMETAASLAKRGVDVTVIAPDKVPFEKVLGLDIGNLFRQVHEKNGVKFRLGEHVNGFEGGEAVRSVILGSGESISADLVIVGVGVRPATAFLDGIELHDDGGVVADKHLQVIDGVYAAGDIVHYPDARTGEMLRIEHWRTALQQGRAAAHNMAGKSTVFSGVPFFWTTQFDATLNYVGHTAGWDEIIYQGELSEQEFLAFYVKDHRVLAAAGMNRDRELAYIEELIRLNRMPTPRRLRETPIDLSLPFADGARSRMESARVF